MMEQLYRRLLVLSSASDVGEILRLLAQATSCELVYVELGDLVRGYSTAALPPGALRARVRDDLLQRAMSEHTTVEVALAPDPARWRSGGVALSTPIGSAGALYVEGRALVADDRQRLEAIAHHLSVIARLLQGSRQSLAEEVQALKELRIREALRRHRNIAEAARILGISRMTIYRTVGVTRRDTDHGQANQTETDPDDLSLDETQIATKPRSIRQMRIASRGRS